MYGSREFFLSIYLPALDSVTDGSRLTSLQAAELTENTAGTVVKLLYAFLWQEAVIDLDGLNLTPEANAAGAALLPRLNQLGRRTPVLSGVPL